MLAAQATQQVHTAGKAILVPILTGAGPILIGIGGLAAFVGFNKDDNTRYNELITGGMTAPAASAAVGKRREKLMTRCLVGFIVGVLVSVAAVVGSLGVF